jgi:hypothetical protein
LRLEEITSEDAPCSILIKAEMFLSLYPHRVRSYHVYSQWDRPAQESSGRADSDQATESKADATARQSHADPRHSIPN